MNHLPIPKLTEKDLARFWANVNKDGMQTEDGSCWEWIAYRDKNGYGQINIDDSLYYTHRISYTIANNDPRELCVCHECDNPPCVNPKHLWLGTNQDNMDDMVDKDRQAKGEERSYKLTEKQIKKILESDETQQVLADRYDVIRQTISDIQRGKRWKHVEGKRYTSGILRSNTTGVKHISRQGRKFRVQFHIKGKRYYLGLFNTVKMAEQALNKWKVEHESQ